MRKSLLFGLVISSALGGASGSGSAQPYTETQRVTLVDLPVEFRSGPHATGEAVKPPGGLANDDLEVVVDGEPRRVISLAPIAEVGPQPYQVLIYVDPELSDSREVQCSLEMLAEQAGGLTRLATVDLVVADPEPRFVLRQTGEANLLEQTLLSEDWASSAGDQLRGLRAGFLEALNDSSTENDMATLERAFILEEARLVEERGDLLLSFLAENAAPGKSRVLLLVGVQYDLDPATFYGSLLGRKSAVAADLVRVTQQLGSSLTALGWLIYPVAPPELVTPLVPGMRIGKWRITGPAGGRVIGLRIARESERDPERARAYLENGRQLLEQGSLVDAESAFRDALHHFYGDPKTAVEQAEALSGLAAALEAQGKVDEARRTLRVAAELDPSVADQDYEALAVVLDPTRPLQELASQSSGRVVDDGPDLETALLGLRRRVRLSIQFEGEPPGQLFDTEITTLRSGLSVAGPRWVRFGPLEAVAAARLRLLEGGWEVEPPADLEAKLGLDRKSRSPTIQMRMKSSAILAAEDPNDDAASETRCRVTLGTGSSEEGTLAMAHRYVECQLSGAGLYTSIPMMIDEEYVSLMLEHLSSGQWGVGVVELE